jgi:hypothetical protein
VNLTGARLTFGLPKVSNCLNFDLTVGHHPRLEDLNGREKSKRSNASAPSTP